MTPTSPALTEAFRLLRAEIYLHLDEAEYLPQHYDTGDDKGFEQMSKVIPDLVMVIRGMLVAHEDDGHGACMSCGRRARGRRTRREAWPCDVVGTIHRLITDPTRSFYELLTQAREI